MLRGMIVALIGWGAGFWISVTILNRHPASALVRGMAVALAVLGLLVWLGWTAKAIRLQNEFTRQIHLLALALAFAAITVFIFVCEMLQRAAFIESIPLTTMWPVMIASWLLALIVSSWYYR